MAVACYLLAHLALIQPGVEIPGLAGAPQRAERVELASQLHVALVLCMGKETQVLSTVEHTWCPKPQEGGLRVAYDGSSPPQSILLPRSDHLSPDTGLSGACLPSESAFIELGTLLDHAINLQMRSAPRRIPEDSSTLGKSWRGCMLILSLYTPVWP